MNLVEMELTYDNIYVENLERLKQHFDECSKLPNIDFEKDDVTCSILLRLRSFYEYQNGIKSALNQGIAPPATYFFVETIAFFIHAVLRILGSALNLYCERPIIKRRGSMRPDISLWIENELKAVIECKTQLGWNRDKWKEDFERRERELTVKYPHSKAFLVVATLKNWSGFGEDPNVGKKWFCLSKDWPTNIDKADPSRSIFHPIEPLLRQILELED